jgi:cellulose synthase/poly-beta-1,6-N-acetylglucosamine synthase-like glycosyltransferase
MTSITGSGPSTSVVIPCYNAGDFIARSIRSVLDQHSANIEVVVIDDGSTDNSLDVVKSFGDRVRWATGPNCGACAARNRGLELSSGDFIMFLDADDYIEPESLSEWAARGSDADLVLCPFAIEKGGKRTFLGRAQGRDAGSILCDWLKGLFTPSCSVLWRRSFLCGIDGWNPKALRNQDAEVTIRALLKGARVTVASSGLGVYVQHDRPGRVSKGTSLEVVSSWLSCFEELWTLAQAQSIEGLRQCFATQFYLIACYAFASGVDEVGQRALRRARDLGLNGHPGSFSHRILVRILGLKNKSRFARVVRSPLSANAMAAWRYVFPTGRGA